MIVTHITGARPNFIKIATIIDAMTKPGEKSIDCRVADTGQHYYRRIQET